MNIKVQLAELYRNQKLPMEEYRTLSAFTMLEKESDIIEKIEEFHLPEITKLICGSEVLGQFPWAEKYKTVRSLYCNTGKMDINQIISECGTVSTFENEILRFADTTILQIFREYYDDLVAREDTKRKERTSLIKKFNSEKKKAKEIINSSTESQDEEENESILKSGNSSETPNIQKLEPSAEEKKLEKLKTELVEIDKYLKHHNVYIEMIREYEVKAQGDYIEAIREKVYRSLDDIKMPYEAVFLNQFISSGVISEEDHVRFHDQNFVSHVLQCLDEDLYKDYSMPVLLKLYDEGVIDLVEGPGSDFIDQHPEYLCVYLVEKTPQSVEDLNNPDFELLIEKAIKKELSNVPDKKKTFFANFWNTITDHNIWRWIVSKVNEITSGENINTSISCLLLKLEGKAAKSLVEVLFDDDELELKISTAEVISSLLKNSGNSERDVIMGTIRLLEQRNRIVQRKLNTSERKLRSYSQELFSSVYLPIEQLEELAINLKLTKGDIKASLVATHLIDIVLSLREGLETLNLQPLANMDDWKYQNKIEFDSSTHCITTESDSLPDMIKLRSLGFRYQDDDGEWQTYNAQASVEVDLPEPEKKVRKGYPKNEQPGKKKNGGAVRYTVSRKTKKGANIQNKHRSEYKKKK